MLFRLIEKKEASEEVSEEKRKEKEAIRQLEEEQESKPKSFRRELNRVSARSEKLIWSQNKAVEKVEAERSTAPLENAQPLKTRVSRASQNLLRKDWAKKAEPEKIDTTDKKMSLRGTKS